MNRIHGTARGEECPVSGHCVGVRAGLPGAMRLERLHCGVITTGAFRDHLKAWHEATAGGHAGLVPQLDYVRCATGERAGQAWISLIWQPLKAGRPHEVFEIGGISVYLPKSTRTGLRDRCLDAADGVLMVR
ncbi:MAG: hypothetical protein V4726_23565 [Verrucomicrobiota bacterium]